MQAVTPRAARPDARQALVSLPSGPVAARKQAGKPETQARLADAASELSGSSRSACWRPKRRLNVQGRYAGRRAKTLRTALGGRRSPAATRMTAPCWTTWPGSPSTPSRRTAEAVGRAIAKAVEPEAHRAKPTLYLGMDGTGIPVRNLSSPQDRAAAKHSKPNAAVSPLPTAGSSSATARPGSGPSTRCEVDPKAYLEGGSCSGGARS